MRLCICYIKSYVFFIDIELEFFVGVCAVSFNKWMRANYQ